MDGVAPASGATGVTPGFGETIAMLGSNGTWLAGGIVEVDGAALFDAGAVFLSAGVPGFPSLAVFPGSADLGLAAGELLLGPAPPDIPVAACAATITARANSQIVRYLIWTEASDRGTTRTACEQWESKWKRMDSWRVGVGS